MRFLSSMSQMKLSALFVSVLAAEPISAQVIGHHSELSMVPLRCNTEQRENVNVERLLVFYNKAITFKLDKIDLKSQIIGNHVEVIYGDEPGTAIFNIGALIPYRARDIRLYHGTLDNRPVIYWAEIVENVIGRGGVLEYRGRALFSLCTGLINRGGNAPQ